MNPETVKQWLDILHTSGDVALMCGIYFGHRVLTMLQKFLDTFVQLHHDVEMIKVGLVKLDLIHEGEL